MKPYYQDDYTTIYHGDCLELLPQIEPVELVLTDPPYGVGIEYGQYEDTPESLVYLIEQVHPLIINVADRTLLTPGVANIHKWPAPKWTLCWAIQGTNSGSGPWGFITWQPVLAYGKDPYLSQNKGRQMDSYLKKTASEKNGHPCPKPLEVWRWFLWRGLPEENGTVLDPFMGSGTTLRAAKDMNRKAIGIEIEEKYCEIAVERLQQEVLQL